MKHALIFSLTLFMLSLIFFSNNVAASGHSELEHIQEAIQQQQVNWTAEENVISRLAPEERRRLNGSLPDVIRGLQKHLIQFGDEEPLPGTLDWRDRDGNWVTPPRDQGNCGSCWAFSAVAQVESWYAIQQNVPDTDIDLSEQMLLSCSEAGSCDGGMLSDALDFIIENGLPSEECMPYKENDEVDCSEACLDWQFEAVQIPGWGFITLEELLIDNVKRALLRHPVSARMMVYEDFYYYRAGIYQHVTGNLEGGHSILIVGWSDADSCWICKNSWGGTWGEHGFFRIKWHECSIGSNMPFIWDELADVSSFSVFPEELELALLTNDSADVSLSLRNSGTKSVEYAVIDYSILQAALFHPDNFNAWEGLSWWSGDEDLEGYRNHWLQYLDTPVINLSDCKAPELTFMAYWAVETPDGAMPPWDGWDGCNVWISKDGGVNFSVLSPQTVEYTCESLWSFGDSEEGWGMGEAVSGWAGNSNTWREVCVSLHPPFSEETVIRFAFASDMGYCTEDDATLTGFQIDDIFVMDSDDVVFSNDAEVTDGMSTTSAGSTMAANRWISIAAGGGTMDPGDSKEITMQVRSGGLDPGSYNGLIRINSNAGSHSEIDIPFLLHVLDPEDVEGLTWQLMQNYPNPFNGETAIQVVIPEMVEANLSVCNVLGQKVKVIHDGVLYPPSAEFIWNGTDDHSKEAGAGLYFLVLKTGSTMQVKKMILLE